MLKPLTLNKIVSLNSTTIKPIHQYNINKKFSLSYSSSNIADTSKIHQMQQAFLSKALHHPTFHLRTLKLFTYLQDNCSLIKWANNFRNITKILHFIVEQYLLTIRHLVGQEVCKAQPPKVPLRIFPCNPR